MTGQHVPWHTASRAVGRALVWLWTVTAQAHDDAVPAGVLWAVSLHVHRVCEHLCCQEQVLGPVFISDKDGNASDFESITFYTFGDSFKSPWKHF